MNNNVDTVKQLLLLLDKKDLEDVSKTVIALLGPKKENNNEDLALFYKIVNKAYGNVYPNLGVLLSTNRKMETRLNSAITFINDYLDNVFKLHNKITGEKYVVEKKHKVIMYNFYGKLMAEWFTDVGVPNSLKSLLVNCDRLPSLVDKQFPNYIKSGLLVPFVFNKHMKGTTDSGATERNGKYVHLPRKSSRNTLRNA